MTSSSTRSTGALGRARRAPARPSGRGQHVVALAPQPAGEHVAVVLVVVDDQDHRRARGRRGRRATRAGRRRRGRSRPATRRPWPSSAPRRSVAGADAIQVGEQRAAPASRRAPVQRSAPRRADARERRLSVPRAAARSGGSRLAAAPAPRSSRVRSCRASARSAVRPAARLGLVAGLELLEQHLGVADDVVERRAQLVAELRGGRRCSRAAQRARARAAPRSSRAAGRARPAWCRSRRSPPPAPSRGRRPWRGR